MLNRIGLQIHYPGSNENLFFILDQIPIGCIVYNLDLTCAHLNPAAEEIFGYRADELRERYPADWIAPASTRSAFLEHFQVVLENGMTRAFESQNVTKSGRVIHCEWQLTPQRDEDGATIGLLSFAKEITERKAAEAGLTTQMERLNALRAIDIAVAERRDLKGLLNVALYQAVSVLRMDAAVVLVYDRENEALVFAAGQGLRTDALNHTKLRLGEGYAGLATLQKKMIVIPDMNQRKTALLRSPMLQEEGFKTYVCLPLIAGGEAVGALEGFFRNPFTPDADWRDFFETLGRHVAIAIDNANRFHNLQFSNQELTRSYDAVLKGWSKALDLRDWDTEGHSRRVTAMTERLAIVMGIGEEERIHIRRGAILHDIGKMSIPDKILIKEGRLDEEEWEIIRRHPVTALDLLSPIPHLRSALDIPYCHHERWDGRGYPRGLRGEQIPLSARIFAVADVYDALISDRPYRPAWPAGQALDYIRTEAGRHFDPNVVSAFLEIFGKTD